MDGHDRTLRAGDRTLDRDQIVLSIDFNDAQVLDGHADRTHVAGQTLALEHAGRAGSGAVRTGMTCNRAGAVALTQAVLAKALDNALIALALAGADNVNLVDKIAADEYKTKTVVAFLAAVGAGKKNLIVNDTLDAKFVKSAANIPGVKTAATGVNTYDVVNADKLILSVDAAKKLEEVYA